MSDDLDALLGSIDGLDLEPPPTDLESKGKPQWSTHGCGARWRNRESYGHCSVCHLTFTSDRAFDAHRYGPMGGPRSCRTAQELTDLGWTVQLGHIYEGSPTADLWSLPRKDEE